MSIRDRTKSITQQDGVWVPEDCMFESGSDCLEAFPDYGPACLLYTNAHINELADERDRLREGLKQIIEISKSGDGTTTECNMAYLADDLLRE